MDGTESQCRWCGIGGDLIVCDDCPSAFCPDCIKRNIGEQPYADLVAEDNDDHWCCYKCDPSQVSAAQVCTETAAAAAEQQPQPSAAKPAVIKQKPAAKPKKPAAAAGLAHYPRPRGAARKNITWNTSMGQWDKNADEQQPPPPSIKGDPLIEQLPGAAAVLPSPVPTAKTPAAKTPTTKRPISQASAAADTKDIGEPSFQVGDQVDAKDTDGTWYGAKIISTSSAGVRVHFKGWNKSHDVNVLASQLATHLAPANKRLIKPVAATETKNVAAAGLAHHPRDKNSTTKRRRSATPTATSEGQAQYSTVTPHRALQGAEENSDDFEEESEVKARRTQHKQNQNKKKKAETAGASAASSTAAAAIGDSPAKLSGLPPLHDVTGGNVYQCTQCVPPKSAGVVVSKQGCSCQHSFLQLPKVGAGLQERRVDEEKIVLIGQTKVCVKCKQLVSSVGFDWKHHMSMCDAAFFADEISCTSLADAEVSDGSVLRCLNSRHAVSIDDREPCDCTACGDDALPDRVSVATLMHPDIPSSALCSSCYDRVSKPFETDPEDNKEMACRWCAKGGDLVICDDCPSAFCADCIKRNMGEEEYNDLTSEDTEYHWSCYKCDPSQVQLAANAKLNRSLKTAFKPQLNQNEESDCERQTWQTSLVPFPQKKLQQLQLVSVPKPQELTAAIQAMLQTSETLPRNFYDAQIDTAFATPDENSARIKVPKVHHRQPVEPEAVSVEQSAPIATFNPLLTEKCSDDVCWGCGSGTDPSTIGICDGCEAEWHASCVGLASFPGGDWFCPQCQVNKNHQDQRKRQEKAGARARAAGAATPIVKETRDKDMQRFITNAQPMHRFSVVPSQKVTVASLAIAKEASIQATGTFTDRQEDCVDVEGEVVSVDDDFDDNIVIVQFKTEDGSTADVEFPLNALIPGAMPAHDLVACPPCSSTQSSSKRKREEAATMMPVDMQYVSPGGEGWERVSNSSGLVAWKRKLAPLATRATNSSSGIDDDL